jgi:ABC-type arginine/histidine transport system permease subunit
MKQHVRPPSALALLSLDHVAGVIGWLLPLHLHTVSVPEVVNDFLAALACKTFEIQRGTSLVVNIVIVFSGIVPYLRTRNCNRTGCFFLVCTTSRSFGI